MSVISNFEGSTLKNKNFKILTFRGAERGPGTKIFQMIRNQGPEIYPTLNFLGSSSNNKKVQNFDRFQNFLVKFRGPKSKFRFLHYSSLGEDNIYPEKMNILAQKL